MLRSMTGAVAMWVVRGGRAQSCAAGGEACNVGGRPPCSIRHPALAAVLRPDADSPTASELDRAQQLLGSAGTLDFEAGRLAETGLFAAAAVDDSSYTGYQNAWTRDNVHLAHALLVTGDAAGAVQVARQLAKFYLKHIHRFDDLLSGVADARDSNRWPHIRFNGRLLVENPEGWGHKQNDAYGYFLWLFAKLARQGEFSPSADEMALLAKFAQLFRKLEFWRVEDNGHWEEAPKVEASSIGTAVAGIREVKALVREQPRLDQHPELAPLLDVLEARGREALAEILPSETRQPGKQRDFDAALLFLIYPLQVVDGAMAGTILRRVEEHLVREHGTLRYLGDSYWHQDWKDVLEAVSSGTNEERDARLEPGAEAQWCIFDSVISVIHGLEYQRTRDAAALDAQRHYLKRSLGHITGPDAELGPWKVPESYYRRKGAWVENDNTPLLWAQANLKVAMTVMKESLSLSVASRL